MTIKYLKPTQSQPEIWWACECKLNMKQYHVFCCYYKVSSDKIQEFSYGAISCLFIVLIFSLRQKYIRDNKDIF